MSIFSTLGVCYRCGDTNGPWTLIAGGWYCDNCYEIIKEKIEKKEKLIAGKVIAEEYKNYVRERTNNNSRL